MVCVLDTDYDRDGVYNAVDLCPYHYDPHQRDFDGDGRGDVCDDDIDGDGVTNTVNVVDDV
jgi:thrombospondin 2/3/4/5